MGYNDMIHADYTNCTWRYNGNVINMKFSFLPSGKQCDILVVYSWKVNKDKWYIRESVLNCKQCDILVVYSWKVNKDKWYIRESVLNQQNWWYNGNIMEYEWDIHGILAIPSGNLT